MERFAERSSHCRTPVCSQETETKMVCQYLKFFWYSKDDSAGHSEREVGLLVVLGSAALSDSISVYIGPSPKEREKAERRDRGE